MELALSAPPTLRSEARVVEAVTAKVPVEVAPLKSASVKCEVEEAKSPPLAQSAEVVAAEITPKLLSKVKGLAPAT